MTSPKKHGFTIVEIVIVIVVVAVLAAVTVSLYIRAQQSARDIKRRSDLIQLAGEFEKYYDKNGAYPSGCSITNAANPTSCQGGGGVNAASDGIYQDTTVTMFRTLFPDLPQDFGDPQNGLATPLKSNGTSTGMLTRYVYRGQLDATGTGGSGAAIVGGQYTEFDCGVGYSLWMRYPSGPLPKSTAFILAYHSELEDKWYVYQGKHGYGLVMPSPSNAPVRGTTLGKCVFLP